MTTDPAPLTPRVIYPKLRWWLWRRLIPLPGVCPARAHTRLIGRGDRWQGIRIDAVCRSDFDRNGNCWCGKLGRKDSHPAVSPGATSDGACR